MDSIFLVEEGVCCCVLERSRRDKVGDIENCNSARHVGRGIGLGVFCYEGKVNVRERQQGKDDGGVGMGDWLVGHCGLLGAEVGEVRCFLCCCCLPAICERPDTLERHSSGGRGMVDSGCLLRLLGT